MDYEKKYKEALEQAKNFYPDNEFLDAIFPELQESEDERIRKELVAMVKIRANDADKERFVDWLEKRKEQKPAEWSEEDEVMIMRALDYVAYFRTACAATKESKECSDWLKSLRPQSHWKPSEEQMRHLLAAQERYALDDMLSSDKTAEALESLYNDLEALIK